MEQTKKLKRRFDLPIQDKSNQMMNMSHHQSRNTEVFSHFGTTPICMGNLMVISSNPLRLLKIILSLTLRLRKIN